MPESDVNSWAIRFYRVTEYCNRSTEQHIGFQQLETEYETENRYFGLIGFGFGFIGFGFRSRFVLPSPKHNHVKVDRLYTL